MAINRLQIDFGSAVRRPLGSQPDTRRSQPGISWARLLLALAIGAIFLVPHLVRIARIGSFAAYSPFSAHSSSPMVFDETFLYGAEANYTLTRGGSPAYDDSWEHRAAVYPFSILPIDIVALTAKAVGGVGNAEILLSFLFPALSALLLSLIFARSGANVILSALLSLMVLVCAFSPRTLWLGDHAFLFHSHGARAINTLEAARMPNPEISFPQFVAAVLCLGEALRRGKPKGDLRRAGRPSAGWAVAAGLIGGLLFFSYIYIAIAWVGALAVLGALALISQRMISRMVWLALAVTAVPAAAFLWWKHIAEAQGNYLARCTRLGMVYGYGLNTRDLIWTAVWMAQALCCAVVWRWLRKRRAERLEHGPESAIWQFADALMPVLLAAMAGGIAGLNMQLITGYNIQAGSHFPHMVLQPVGLMMMGVLVALISHSVSRRYGSARYRAWRIAVPAAFAMALTACAAAQVEAAKDTAALHRIAPGQQALFDRLNAGTATGSVVATDDLALSVVLPVRTHNSVLFSDGSRSSASDKELMERFLLASRLSGAPPWQVERELANRVSAGTAVPVATYSYYLYETSPYANRAGDRYVAARYLPALMSWYKSMCLAAELRRFRVDYVWTETGRTPPVVAGVQWVPVFTSEDGRLWHFTRDQTGAGNAPCAGSAGPER